MRRALASIGTLTLPPGLQDLALYSELLRRSAPTEVLTQT